MPKSTPQDFIEKFDVELVKRLVNDAGGTISDKEAIESPKLEKALSAASGRVLAALRQGSKYQQEDIDALTGDAAEFYITVETCVAMSELLRRKPQMITEELRTSILGEADNYLDQLRRGINVLGIDSNISAGVPTAIHMPEPSVFDMQKNSMATKATGRLYPYRNS